MALWPCRRLRCFGERLRKSPGKSVLSVKPWRGGARGVLKQI